MSKFKSLTERAQLLLKSKNVNPIQMKSYLVSACATKKSTGGQKMVDELFGDCTGIDAIFHHMEQYELWDFINHYLFEDIVAEFLEGCPAIQEHIKEYEVVLEENVMPMSLNDFIRTCQNMKILPQRIGETWQKYFIEWTLTITVAQMEIETRYIDNLRASLAIEFEVPRTLILLASVELTSTTLTIVWIVPNIFCDQIYAKAHAGLQWFQHLDLVMMKLGKNSCFEVKTVT